MSPWKTLVVEDERLTREHICQLVEGDPELDLVASCSGVEEAIRLLSQMTPDLLLLDIELPDGQSFEILERLTHAPALIFITAYDGYAIRAFEEMAIDYLLKPFDRERFAKAIGRAKAHLSQTDLSRTLSDLRTLMMGLAQTPARSRSAGDAASEYLPIRVNGTISLHPVEEITRIEAEGKRIRIHFGGESHLAQESLSGLEERLSHLGMVRVHRSTLVNIREIAEIHPWFHGDYLLIMRDGTRVKLSRRYKPRLEERLGGKV